MNNWRSPIQRDEIRWILFDYGGVLAEEGFRDALAAVSEHHDRPPEELPRLAMDAVYDSGYVTGHGSEREFWTLLRQRFPLSDPDTALSAEILRRFTLREPMIRLVDGLRKRGYLTAILSDQTDWLEQLDRRDHFSDHFDRVFNSFEIGKGKRDPALFTDVVTELTIAPSQAIFIDDNPENIRRAVSRGLHGVHYTSMGGMLPDLARLLDIPADELARISGEIYPVQAE